MAEEGLVGEAGNGSWSGGDWEGGLFRGLGTGLYGGLSVVGVVGNVLVMLVVVRVRGMLTPTNCYLVSLAASDCLFFLSFAPTELHSLHSPRGHYRLGDLACKLLTAASYLGVNISSLSIAAFTVERYIGICHPMRAKSLCTVKRARSIIASIWAGSIAYNSLWLYLARTQASGALYADIPQPMACTFRLARSHGLVKLVFSLDIFLFYLVPMLLYVLLYGRIAYILMRGGVGGSRRVELEREKGGGSRRSGGSAEGREEGPRSSFLRSRSGSAASQRETIVCSDKAFRARVQVIKMLGVIVVVFMTCWLPYRALVFLNSFVNVPWVNKWYVMFAKVLICLNCAINPILYNLMSGKFRAAFRTLLASTSLRSRLRSTRRVPASHTLPAFLPHRPPLPNLSQQSLRPPQEARDIRRNRFPSAPLHSHPTSSDNRPQAMDEKPSAAQPQPIYV